MKLAFISLCVFAIVVEFKESEAALVPNTQDEGDDGPDNSEPVDDVHDETYLQRFILNYGKYIILLSLITTHNSSSNVNIYK